MVFHTTNLDGTTPEAPFPSILNDKTLSTIFSDSDIVSGGSPTNISASSSIKNMLDYVIDEEYTDDEEDEDADDEGGPTLDETISSSQRSQRSLLFAYFDDEEATQDQTTNTMEDANTNNYYYQNQPHPRQDFFGSWFDKWVCGTSYICRASEEVIREWQDPEQLEKEMEQLRDDMALKPSLLHLRRQPPKQVKPPSSILLKSPAAAREDLKVDPLTEESPCAPTATTMICSNSYNKKQPGTNNPHNGKRFAGLPTREMNKKIRSKSFKDRERQLAAQRRYVEEVILRRHHLRRNQYHGDDEGGEEADSDCLSVTTSASESEFSAGGASFMDESCTSTSSLSSASRRFYSRRRHLSTTPPRLRARTRGSPARKNSRRQQSNKLRNSPSRWSSHRKRRSRIAAS